MVELALRERVLAGDPEVFRELIVASMPTLHAELIGAPGGVERADLEQIAAETLIHVARSFDPDREDFRAWATTRIQRRLALYLRAERRRRSRAFSMIPSDEERHAVELATRLDAHIESPRLGHAIGRLSPRMRALIARLYWRQASTEEIAREDRVQVAQVRRLRRIAEAQLREAMLSPDTAPDAE